MTAGCGTTRRKVYLVIQNAWDTTTLTMPLALGYLKAYAQSDSQISREFDIRIFNFPRGASVSRMALELFAEPPDIIGFSVLGWNFQNFGRLAETFRQVKPNGWCVFGGNHASHQAERIFRLFPSVDLVVNGEGEVTFLELLRAFAEGLRIHQLDGIRGLSLRGSDGTLVTTVERGRLADLDQIPSPFLTGNIPLYGANGAFLYDVALMETSRGCPYSCSFCYWGGAVGQKMFAFSTSRLREELEFFAYHQIECLALCDSNFGLRPADVDFAENLVEVRRLYGYPQNLTTSWTKNKSQAFYKIVRILNETDLYSDFVLSLQTLDPTALSAMNRRNMKLNEFEEICDWLQGLGMEFWTELIWGAPGETVESFIRGYDRVAEYTSKIATYPMCILPNTHYADERERYRMVTVRDNATDFEFVLAHESVSIEDNRRMHRFLFWSRLLAEYAVFRMLWRPLRKLGGVKQSEVLLSLESWFSGRSDVHSRQLTRYERAVVDSFDVALVSSAADYVHRYARELAPVFEQWFDEVIAPYVPVEHSRFLKEVLRYDWASQPYCDSVAVREKAPVVEHDGIEYYARSGLSFEYDVPRALAEFAASGWRGQVSCEPVDDLTLYYRTGFEAVSETHELVHLYVGKTMEELDQAAADREAGIAPEVVQPRIAGLSGSDAVATLPQAVED